MLAERRDPTRKALHLQNKAECDLQYRAALNSVSTGGDTCEMAIHDKRPVKR